MCAEGGTGMSVMETVRHRASIAGYVTDARSKNILPGSIVRITALHIEVQAGSDGFFYFLDLPLGQYALDVAVPASGSLYGAASVPGVVVENDEDGRPIFDGKANVALSPTMLTGQVTQSSDGQPITNAVVQVLGGENKTVTDKDGNYALSPLLSGTPNIRASAKGFVAVTKKVTLSKGVAIIADFILTSS